MAAETEGSRSISETTPQRIGFVGLGNQGGPIAGRIAAAGHELTVWARRPEATAPFAAAGGRVADDVESLARASDILCVCVVDDAGVRDVAASALPVMAPGGLLLILSTVHPDTCRALAVEAAARGIDLVDAPVSGGAAAARAGTLTVMLGGSAAACDRLAPLLAGFAGLVVRLGEVGAGQTAKLVNNALMAANLALAAEAVDAGAALGLDRAALHRVIAASSGRSFAHDALARLPRLAAFAGGAALLAKDVGLLGELAGAAGVEVGRLTDNGRAFVAQVAADNDQPGETE